LNKGLDFIDDVLIHKELKENKTPDKKAVKDVPGESLYG